MARLGKIRRSQVISTYGPGAIVDFRAGKKGGAPVSIVTAGLDEWDNASWTAGLMNDQCISEPRLQKKLRVDGFRLPPVGYEYRGSGQNREKRIRQLNGIRFPDWLQCPACGLLQHSRNWAEDPGDPALYCSPCSRKSEAGRRVHVIPVRFVLACPDGHLDEFPWHHWVGHKEGCDRRKPLRLVTRGAGLKGLWVNCTGCSAGRSMEQAFSSAMMQRMNIRCSGRRPWLPGPNEACSQAGPPKAVQRGASNLYFPATDSAIDIPPWTDEFQTALGQHWAALQTAASMEDADLIVRLVVWPQWDGQQMTLEEMQQKVRQRLALINAPERQDIRGEEYQQLTLGEATRDPKSEFCIRPEPVPPVLSGLLSNLVRVVRLREVRALYGFTRIYPPSGEFGSGTCSPLSAAPKKWLPAAEVRGEGIFIALDQERVGQWELQPAVQERAARVDHSWKEAWKDRGNDGDPPFPVTPRLILVHTLSHVLMRQLALDCGYSTSSIRERIYASDEDPGMCGLLIYTSAADADGTLGGLERQGKPERFISLVRDAVRSVEWCSSDPLCMNGLNSWSESGNLAACHSCVLAPETACEHFNRFLDRAMIVGLPGDPAVGFFHQLLAMEEV